ncbi:MAG TPA: aminotransferase class I/II-fold pyridoxal phosphate-dependent enzyme [Cytophagales bacterium]|nr:aminotransferase class I/II-fold pyridoxal phosphate-dependent enzyme [Cytophagales bacterium]
MAKTTSLPGRTTSINNKEYLYFSGTSYLGISHNQAFRELLFEGMNLYGSNFSSSRISNLQLAIFEEAENYLSEFIGTGSALTVSSGFLAGKILIEYLKGRGKFIYAPNTHPALTHTNSDFYSGDFDDWVENLIVYLKEEQEDVFLISNSVDPLYAKPTSFDWISKLPKDKRITLIIDDSHGLGIIGEEGQGIFQRLSKTTEVDIVIVGSLGKALGIPGGVIAGSKKLIEGLKMTSAFGGSSPIIPAYLHAFTNAGEVYKEARKKLRKNINYFINLLPKWSMFSFLPDFPVFYTQDQKLYNFLFSKDILISSFPYPTPQDLPITRIVINALHEKEDLEKLSSILNRGNQFDARNL